MKPPFRFPVHPRRRAWIACCVGLSFAAASVSAAVTDMIRFGSSDSENRHAFRSDRSEVVTGGLGEPARRLLPRDPVTWFGGKLAFRLEVDGAAQNYLTVRLWGSDVSHHLLLLYCEGKQIGYRHLGDYECLDLGTDAPSYPHRFSYKTLPIPHDLTRGKETVEFEIRSYGPLWGYGKSFEQYQKPMTEPTRGIYRAYAHTDGYFLPPAEEQQGASPQDLPVRTGPGPEVMDAIRERVNREIKNLLQPGRIPSQMQMLFLAKAYHTRWTDAFGNPRAVEQILASLDHLYRAYRQDPALARSEPSTYNPEWFGLGPSGQAIALLAEPLNARFPETIDDGNGNPVPRRAAFVEMLTACRDWHRENRRQYTNQSMINDLYGIYLANRGIAVLDPSQAMPERECRRYLYESIGLQPWLGSERDGKPLRPLGDHFHQLTAKGLTRELGFVGNYGEVTDWVSQIHEATKPSPGQPGDPRIRAQLAHIALARAPFRYPLQDADGYRAMIQETIVGWRDTHVPGDVTYAQRPSRDGSALEASVATLHPKLVGYAQQLMEDNQLFASLAKQASEEGFRVTFGLLAVPEQYETMLALPPSKERLPMTGTQPDFVFTDEENGVIAVKNGAEILYASLYWRARYGVNFLARIHLLAPDYERIATVRQDIEYTPSGMEYIRPDWTNFGFGNGGHRYPDDPASAHHGEKLPIAAIPDGLAFTPGDEHLYAGRGHLYQLRYGPYFLVMNLSPDQAFSITVPDGPGDAVEWVTGREKLAPGTVCEVQARSSLVFYFAPGEAAASE